MNGIESGIIIENPPSVQQLAKLIGADGEMRLLLKKQASETTIAQRGNKVYYRGLIEFSNICIKDCNYCGIRKSNAHVVRYLLDEDVIVEAAMYAWKNHYGSVVLQSGERTDPAFIDLINRVLLKIKKKTAGELGITLSLGEQTESVYNQWFKNGAHRYLLRIETSNRNLYKVIHPQDCLHLFSKRLECLKLLKKIGFQTGTGVMIGLPGQTCEDLANDLLLFKELDIDMVGMGPYIEHEQTPLFHKKEQLWPLNQRFETALNMIATLRLLMPDVNIAAATALQSIDPMGREKALQWGANIIMPNITPTENRKNYLLYQNKPCTDEGADDCSSCLKIRIEMAGKKVGFDEWGDSLHFFNRQNRNTKIL